MLILFLVFCIPMGVALCVRLYAMASADAAETEHPTAKIIGWLLLVVGVISLLTGLTNGMIYNDRFKEAQEDYDNFDYDDVNIDYNSYKNSHNYDYDIFSHRQNYGTDEYRIIKEYEEQKQKYEEQKQKYEEQKQKYEEQINKNTLKIAQSEKQAYEEQKQAYEEQKQAYEEKKKQYEKQKKAYEKERYEDLKRQVYEVQKREKYQHLEIIEQERDAKIVNACTSAMILFALSCYCFNFRRSPGPISKKILKVILVAWVCFVYRFALWTIVVGRFFLVGLALFILSLCIIPTKTNSWPKKIENFGMKHKKAFNLAGIWLVITIIMGCGIALHSLHQNGRTMILPIYIPLWILMMVMSYKLVYKREKLLNMWQERTKTSGTGIIKLTAYVVLPLAVILTLFMPLIAINVEEDSRIYYLLLPVILWVIFAWGFFASKLDNLSRTPSNAPSRAPVVESKALLQPSVQPKLWTLSDFVQTFGKMRLGTTTDAAGKEYKTCIFVSADGRQTQVEIPESLAQLSAQEIAARKQTLGVAQNERGTYSLQSIAAAQWEDVDI